MLIVRDTLDRGRRKCGTGGSNCIILGDSLREQPGFETHARLHSALDERRGCNPHCRKVFSGESKSACPCMCRQLTHYTQTLDREWVPVTRSLEPGIASKMCLASLVEWPSQVCTHRPSHCISSRSSEVVTRCPSWKVGMDRARYPSRSVCHPALLPTES